MRLLLPCLLSLLLTGCKSTTEDPPKQPAPPPAKKAVAKAVENPEADPPAKPPAPVDPGGMASTVLRSELLKSTPTGDPCAEAFEEHLGEKTDGEGVTDYLIHLGRGRSLGREKRWGQAVAALERALALAGRRNPVVLSELGWARLQAGDLPRAFAASMSAVSAAKEPRRKAAALYNLGRAAEALGQPKLAAMTYRESIELRPSKAVSRRLAALEQGGGTRRIHDHGKTRSRPHACRNKRSLEAVCACLQQRKASTEVVGKWSCEPDKAVSRSWLKVLDVSGAADESGGASFLVVQRGESWSVLGPVLAEHEGVTSGTPKTTRTGEVTRLELQRLEGRRLIWIEDKVEESDKVAGDDFVELQRRLTLCEVPDDVKQPARCPLSVETESLSYQEDPMPDCLGLAGGCTAQHRDKICKISAETQLQVQLFEDGTVVVSLVRGRRTAALDAVLGLHRF